MSQIGTPDKFGAIEALSTELLHDIFEYVYQRSPTSINSLVFVNRKFYVVACGFRHRNLNLKFVNLHDHPDDNHNVSLDAEGVETVSDESKDSYAKIQSLIMDPAKAFVLQNIRYLTISSTRCTKHYCPDHHSQKCHQCLEKKWRPVLELLAKVSNLKELTFTGDDQVPICLLNAVEKFQPDAKLYLPNWRRLKDDDDHTDPAELALALSPNLYSISASLWNTSVQFDLRLAALKRIIALSPSLEKVEISEGRSGCKGRPHRMDREVEKARIHQFDVDTPSQKSIKILKTNRAGHVRHLRDVTDFSKLEQLEVKKSVPRAGIFEEGMDPGDFRSLRHLSIPVTDQDMLPFILNIQPLETLCLWGNYRELPLCQIFERHGPKLRTILLHESESLELGNLRKGPSMQNLEDMARLCPNLEDVTIDLSRAASSPLPSELLSSLAQFPKLKRVGVYLDLGIAKHASRLENKIEEELRADMAECIVYRKLNKVEDTIWRILYKERLKGSLPVLDVKVGEVEREPTRGYPANWVIWEGNNARHITVQSSDRDDRANEAVVITRKDRRRFSVERNDKLRLLLMK